MRSKLANGSRSEGTVLEATRRLVLTHFSDELDADWARAEAGEAFGGPVEMAYEGAVYAVPAGESH